MEKNFRLYSSISSSYFDLISGDKETQQTKGLGLVLSKSEQSLKAFLGINSIKSKIEGINLDSSDRLIVNCEPISNSENSYRADIILRFYKKHEPILALVIEAKSINKSTSAENASDQVKKYIESDEFKELGNFKDKCLGITLTKLPSYISDENMISITWNDIITAFYNVKPHREPLLDDYFNFLTNINGAMKFYEKEVFSIPIGKGSEQAIKDFYVYECPNSSSFLIKYKPLFITFRKSGGGEMEKIYKVEDIIILNFKKDYKAFLKDDNYDLSYRNRVERYVNFVWPDENKLPSDEKQVFILSENPIELKNRPKPKNGNNSFRAYYELADLLNKAEV